MCFYFIIHLHLRHKSAVDKNVMIGTRTRPPMSGWLVDWTSVSLKLSITRQHWPSSSWQCTFARTIATTAARHLHKIIECLVSRVLLPNIYFHLPVLSGVRPAHKIVQLKRLIIIKLGCSTIFQIKRQSLEPEVQELTSDEEVYYNKGLWDGACWRGRKWMVRSRDVLRMARPVTYK